MRHDVPVIVPSEIPVDFSFIEHATITGHRISAMKRYFVEAKAWSDKH